MPERTLPQDICDALDAAPDGRQLRGLAEALITAHQMDDDHHTRRDEICDQLLATHRRLYSKEHAGLLQTPLGWVALTWSERGLRRLALPRERKQEALATLQQQGSPTLVEQPPEALAEPLRRYFAGEPNHPELPVDLSTCPAFRRSVLELVSSIPYGETRSYRWIAEALGVRSYRAVGQAVGANPVPIVIPCHRVVASDGSLRGYAGGLKLKQRLLDLEHAGPYAQ